MKINPIQLQYEMYVSMNHLHVIDINFNSHREASPHIHLPFVDCFALVNKT